MQKNDGGVNYIRHLLGISEKFIDDERLSPLHISLYYALFQSWNLSKFRNPISVSRDELMRASKIGSANTYTKCLKELDAWEYIKYYPSYNPHKGSQVYLYNFNKSNNNATDISNNKGSDKAAEKGTAKTTVKAVIPSINSLNNTNKSNNTKENELAPKKNNRKSFATDAKSPKSKKVAPKKESAAKGFKRPLLQEVKNYFAENKYPAIESQKFFNHYESNGWRVGKVPMQNWQSSANKWVLNAEKFSNDKAKPTAGKLHATGNKDYSEPL